MDFQKLFKPNIFNLKPYTSARDEYSGNEGIFFDANENPYGSAINYSANRYPDPLQREAKKQLATYKQLKEDQVFIGNGSDEIIDLLIKAICKSGEDEILIFPPTYGMYQVIADIYEVPCVKIPLTKEFQLDLDGIKEAYNSKSKIAWVCSPNNPTGALIDINSIISLLKEYPEMLIVVDEAYIDFSGQESMIKHLSSYENLFILQTFSKSWGLAGLRLGAGYGHPEVIKILNKIKFPYNISILSQNALLEALRPENIHKKEQYIVDLNTNREQLKNDLLNLGIVQDIFPSDSNQLLVIFDDADMVFNKLLSNKIIVRNRSKEIGCENGLRITVGTKEENEALINALKEI